MNGTNASQCMNFRTHYVSFANFRVVFGVFKWVQTPAIPDIADGIQLVPQWASLARQPVSYWCSRIWTNYRVKKTDGLPGIMMFLWAICVSPKLLSPSSLTLHRCCSIWSLFDRSGLAVVSEHMASSYRSLEFQHPHPSPATSLRYILLGQLGTNFDLPRVRSFTLATSSPAHNCQVVGQYGKPHPSLELSGLCSVALKQRWY